MVHIRNGNDLRTAYGILRDMQGRMWACHDAACDV